jgi:hypothetical protein
MDKERNSIGRLTYSVFKDLFVSLKIANGKRQDANGKRQEARGRYFGIAKGLLSTKCNDTLKIILNTISFKTYYNLDLLCILCNLHMV